MKYVTRDELMQHPKGTVFFEFGKAGQTVRLMRFDGQSNDDFLESVIGPYVVNEDTDKACPYEHLSIDTDNGREGLFDNSLTYVVLEEEDILAMVKQLTGGVIEQRTLEIVR